MKRKSDRTGVPRLSMIMLMSVIVVATAAVGFIFADSGDIPDSEGATHGTCGDDLMWTVDSEGNLKIEGSGPMYNYSFSSVRWGGNEIKTATVGDSVTSIGKYAFVACDSLTTVTIGDSVTSIGDDAFFNCTSLASVTIGKTVTSIGDDAFYYCESLGSISIPDSVTSIGEDAFYCCTSLVSVTIGDSVTSIGGYAFNYCTSLTSVTIPDSVTSIGAWAFSNCTSLKSVVIGSSVVSIGGGAFYKCDSVTGFEVSGSNARYSCVDGVLYDKNRTQLVQYPVSRADASFTVPSWVTSIGDYAFADCAYLGSVTFPATVTSISDRALVECISVTGFEVDGSNPNYSSAGGVVYNKEKTELIQYPLGRADTSFSVPSTVTSIGDYAFLVGRSLESVDIPDSVTSIGKYAFAACQSLASVTIPDSVTSIGIGAFKGCFSLEEAVIGGSVKILEDGLFNQCSSLTTVTIPDSVTAIGEEVFYGCTSLTSLTIPDSVTSIGYRAFSDHVFYDADGVTVLEQTASNLAGSTFIGESTDRMVRQGSVTPNTCGKNLTWTIDSDGNLRIEGSGPMYDYSYSSDSPWGRDAVRSVVIGDSVTSIGDYAFSACTSLTSVTIGDAVTSIGDSAFFYCTSLASVTFGTAVESIGIGAFTYCTSLTSIALPDSVTSIGWIAFSYCTSLTSITIPASVTSVGTDAFYSHAFYDADGVTVLGPTVSNLAGYTFKGEAVDRMIRQDSPRILTFDGTELKVTLNGAALTSPAEVDSGTKVVVTAVAKAGYTAEITAGTTEIADGSEYTVTGNVRFTVTYVPETYTLAIVGGTAEVFSQSGFPLLDGATVSYGDIVTVEPIVPEGKKVSAENIEGLVGTGDGYTVVGDVTVGYEFADIRCFDLTFTETDGVVYKLNGIEVSGTVEDVQEGTVLAVEVEVGYMGMPAVQIDGAVIAIPYSVVKGGVVTVDGVEPAGIFVVVFDPSEVEVTAGGEEIGSFDRVVGGTEITVALAGGVDGTIYVNDEKYTGAFALAGDVLITVGAGDTPTPDPECSSDIVMGMRTTSDGNVKVILAADDAKAIPSGKVTVTMSYAMVDEYGIWDIDSVRITAEVEYTGDGYRIVNVTLTDNEYYQYATGVVASFTDGDSIYDSNKLQFTPLATAR